LKLSKKARLKDVQVTLDCPYCDNEIVIPMGDLVKIITQAVLGREKDAQAQ